MLLALQAAVFEPRLAALVHGVVEGLLSIALATVNNYNIALIAIISVLLVLLALFIGIARRYDASSKELGRLNDRHMAFFDAGDTIIYLKDHNGRFGFANSAFKRFVGLGDDSVVCGKEGRDLVPAALADLFEGIESNAFEEMRTVSDDIEWERRLYTVKAFPVRMEQNRLGVGVNVRDVTLERSHMRLQQKIFRRNEILVDVLNGSFKSKSDQLAYILEQALMLTESKYGCVLLYDRQLSIFTEAHFSQSLHHDYPDSIGLSTLPTFLNAVFDETIKLAKPVLINDYSKYVAGRIDPDEAANTHLPKRCMCVPVIIDGEIVAVAALADRDTNYFGNAAYEATLLFTTAWNAFGRREAQESLILERNKYLQTILSIGDGVMVVDAQGNVDMLNTVAENLTGWTLKEARGKPYLEIFHLSSESCTGDCDPIQRVFKTNVMQTMQDNAVLTSRAGDLYLLEDSAAPIRDESGAMVGVVLVFRDVSDKREQRQRIEYLSMHDSLTGLYNRPYFELEMLRLDKPENLPISVIMGDVNDLKLTNDIFGHSAGDLSLRFSALAVQSVCRPMDIAARWGGDEFVLMLPRTTLEEANSILESIHAEISKRKVAAIQCTMSLGVDAKRAPHEDIWQVLTSAEQKMYTEKSTRRSLLQENTFDAIVEEFYKHAPREREHAARVCAFSVRIGRAMGLADEELRKLRDAANVHDLGKIVLDPELTKKNGLYSEFEASEMKKHASAGYRILNSFDKTLNLAEIILSHHERYDGQGYPKGLRGTQIPLLARIITIAECYERMTRDSTGLPIRTHEEALAVIAENAGTQFDPYIAGLFLELMRDQNG